VTDESMALLELTAKYGDGELSPLTSCEPGSGRING